MPKNPFIAGRIEIDTANSNNGIYTSTGTTIIDSNGNIDAPVTTTDLTTTGNTTLGDASADTLTINATTTALAAVTIGVDDTGLDFKAFGATAGAHMLWDESADTLKLVGAAKLNAQGTVTVGVDGTGFDVQFFGATASAHMLWDESADNLLLVGTAGLSCTSPTGDGIGYGTGAGGAVTQITNRSTGVTVSKLSGTIQTDTTSLAAVSSAEFTVTNTQVAIGDVVICSQQSGSSNVAGTAGVTQIEVVTVAAGSFIISVNNQSTTTAETGAIIINFAVIKAVAA